MKKINKKIWKKKITKKNYKKDVITTSPFLLRGQENDRTDKNQSGHNTAFFSKSKN